MHVCPMDKGSVTENGNLSLRKIFVSHLDSIVYDTCEIRMGSRFAIACKGYDVKFQSLAVTLHEHFGEGILYLLTGGALALGFEVLVESAFTVYAVERANLAVARHQVDAKRYAQSARVYRTENR
jgi:hypothetical protein